MAANSRSNISSAMRGECRLCTCEICQMGDDGAECQCKHQACEHVSKRLVSMKSLLIALN